MDRSHIKGLGFAGKTMQTFAALSFTQVVYFAVGIITARVLGPSEKGVLAIVNLYPMVLLTLLNLSIYRAVTVHVAEGKYPFSHFPVTLMAYGFVSTAIMVALFAAAYYLEPRYFISQAPAWLVFAAMLMIPFVFIVSVFGSLLEVKNEVSLVNVKDIFNSLALLLSIVVGLLVLRARVSGAALAYVAAHAMTSAVVVGMVRRLDDAPWMFDGRLLRALVRDGAKLHFAVIANFILLRVDMLILGYFKPSASVGYYSLSVSLSETLFILMMAIQTAFYSGVPDMLKDKKTMAHKTMAIYRHSLVWFAAGAVLLVALSPFVILLFYGREFLPAQQPLFILLPGALLLYQHNVLGTFLISNKKFWAVSSICALGATLNVILNILWIPLWDSDGAALASTVAYLLNAVMLLVLFCRTANMTLGQFFRQAVLTRDDTYLYIATGRQLLNMLKGKGYERDSE